MSDAVFYHLLKLIHIIAIISVGGGSFAVTILGFTYPQPPAVLGALLKNIGMLVMHGLNLAIVSGLVLVFTYSTISHPVFDIKMTILVLALILGGYIRHSVLPKIVKTIPDTVSDWSKFFLLQRINTVLMLIIVTLGVFL